MHEYKFYGWETANITDLSGRTPRNYYDLLSKIWCIETCAPKLRSEWSVNNKTKGQCSITSFLLQDIYGGKVYGILLKDGSYHCFNIVGDCVFDLTSEQFGDKILNYKDCVEQYRENHFADKGKLERYRYLKSKIEQIINRKILEYKEKN